ncbi:hypothetical protein HanRHA438_Chr03g0098121 [Helianthus annuus]|nr:hypothetical protein HanRHA438_Chr03g0098121 [Helianthus annuus]
MVSFLVTTESNSLQIILNVDLLIRNAFRNSSSGHSSLSWYFHHPFDLSFTHNRRRPPPSSAAAATPPP